MAQPTSCCAVPGGYCARVDTLFNLPGVHALDVAWQEWRRKLPAGLRLLVETRPAPTGYPGCGVIAEARGRRVRRLHDIPAIGVPVELFWRQRRCRCAGLQHSARLRCPSPLTIRPLPHGRRRTHLEQARRGTHPAE